MKSNLVSKISLSALSLLAIGLVTLVSANHNVRAASLPQPERICVDGADGHLDCYAIHTDPPSAGDTTSALPLRAPISVAPVYDPSAAPIDDSCVRLSPTHKVRVYSVCIPAS